MSYNKYLDILKEHLDDYRYNHSLCVALEAQRLAEKYNCDLEKAYLAGLLHDITKNESSEFHLNYLNRFGIILSDVELKSPKLWHAISGSVFVKNELKIDDEEIISAIRYHTTAKSNMSLLDKVIYVADFTSCDRNYPDVDVMREKAEKSLENAIIYAVSYTVNKLIKDKNPVHPDTIAAYNDAIIKIKQK